MFYPPREFRNKLDTPFVLGYYGIKIKRLVTHEKIYYAKCRSSKTEKGWRELLNLSRRRIKFEILNLPLIQVNHHLISWVRKSMVKFNFNTTLPITFWVLLPPPLG